jgi:hypothetical protein
MDQWGHRAKRSGSSRGTSPWIRTTQDLKWEDALAVSSNVGALSLL